jgi:hypothetical protein
LGGASLRLHLRKGGGNRRWLAARRRQEWRIGHPEERGDSMAGPRLGQGGLHWLGGPAAEWASAKKTKEEDLGPKGV